MKQEVAKLNVQIFEEQQKAQSADKANWEEQEKYQVKLKTKALREPTDEDYEEMGIEKKKAEEKEKENSVKLVEVKRQLDEEGERKRRCQRGSRVRGEHREAGEAREHGKRGRT